MNVMTARCLGGYMYTLRRRGIEAEEFENILPHNKFLLRNIGLHHGRVTPSMVTNMFNATVEGMSDEELFKHNYKHGFDEVNRKKGDIGGKGDLIRLEQPEDGEVV